MEIYGILNITPDSFSDGGNYLQLDDAKVHVEEMINAGATIIDIGGESTRPGAEFVSIEEEIRRVVPIIEMIKANYDVAISIDTYKSEVARAAVEAGATIINDVQANAYDGKMLQLVAEYNVQYVAMHSRAVEEGNLQLDIEFLFIQILNLANELGIKNEQIILDPGIGFNKNINDNLKIIKNLDLMKSKFPNNKLLLGTSRKRFIGSINNLPAAKDRVIGTVTTTILAYQAGFDYVRAHDVLANKQAIEMLEAIESYE